MSKITKINSKLLFLIFALVLSIPAVIGLLHNGFFASDDGNWMVIRFSAFYEALRSGQFPVRFLTRLNNGFGYPVADFLYPLFMYLGVPIHALGFSFVTTVKILFGLSLFFSTTFTFLWLRKLFDNISSLVGSVFYTLFPYHIYDVYTRGSLGEVLALSLLPFVLWQIERRSLVFTSLGISLLILSHNTLALLFIPLIIGYIFLRNRKFSKFDLLSFIFGLGISSFFWIPALYDSQYTVFSKTQVSDFSSYFVNDNLGILGLSLGFLILESVFYFIRKKDKLFLILLLTLLVISFLSLSLSELLWKFFPFTNLIQFPFRIVSIIIPLSAFMTAYLLNKENLQKKYLLSVTYLIIIFIAAAPFLFPKEYQYYPDTFYSTNQDTTTVRNEYMPKWVKNIPTSYTPQRVELLSGEEKINVESVTASKIVFNTYLTMDREVKINIIYFPGWKAYINGKEAKINYENEEGLIRLSLEKGKNNVSVVFSETPVRILSDFISIISIGGLFACYYFVRKKKFNI